MGPEAGEITALLRNLRASKQDGRDRLAELIYTQLRRLASSKMRSERQDHTLSATALAHEAWLQVSENESDFVDRAHFFAVASHAMRRILIDHARARNAVKRGGGEIVRLD